MKIKNILFLILLLITPFFASADIEDYGVGTESIWVKTGPTAGVGGDYIDAPAPFGDDDYAWACWYWGSGASECSGFHDHDNTGSPPSPDTNYTFTDTTTDPDTTFTIYMCGYDPSITVCGTGSSTATTSPPLTYQENLLISCVIIFMLSINTWGTLFKPTKV